MVLPIHYLNPFVTLYECDIIIYTLESSYSYFMIQYSLPQFIEEEGKIVFFLTYRQFFLLVGGGAVSFLMIFTLPLPIAIGGTTLVMAIVSAIAFIKINGFSIIKIIMHFFGFTMQTKNYVWKKEE